MNTFTTPVPSHDDGEIWDALRSVPDYHPNKVSLPSKDFA